VRVKYIILTLRLGEVRWVDVASSDRVLDRILRRAQRRSLSDAEHDTKVFSVDDLLAWDRKVVEELEALVK